jgi:transcription elongation factor GreA
MKDIFLTKDGIEKLHHELQSLIDVDRKEIIKKIKETREYGDLSENAEYDAARTQQSMIEGRIEELEALLKKARVIDTSKHKAVGKVAMGDKVKVKHGEDESEFSLVGSAESNPSKGLISIESPIGKALLGAKLHDTVHVSVPDGGTVDYTIVSIN